MLISREAYYKYKLSSIIGKNLKIDTNDYYKLKLLTKKINSSKSLVFFPEEAARSSELFASAILFEFFSKIFDKYSSKYPDIITSYLDSLKKTIGEKEFEEIEKDFLSLFPTPEIIEGMSVEEYLRIINKNNLENELIKKILLVYLFNDNPALKKYKELIDDSVLRKKKQYNEFYSFSRKFFNKKPPLESNLPSLVEMMEIPVKNSPTEILKQVEFVAKSWGFLIPELQDKLLNALDFLKEETKIRLLGKGETPELKFGGIDLPEAFSEDTDWMPRVVMIAKNTFVWLWQLSQKYGKEIKTLDQIPEEELERLSRWGINAVWLIGIWERSPASKKIKQLMGNPDAEASAYSIYDYRVARKLGGDEAVEKLKQKAGKYGIRLATDMVPNHTGIDSVWVIDHPEWFIQTDKPPFPSYSFNGPDLSSTPDIGIYLEDHYYDRTDAAVVFKRTDKKTGKSTYIYHGNDGTSMPWNDTAQLNYLLEEVREKVIQTILAIGRRFPIIRFDAAMTLTKMHFQRLWYPLPGQGGDIPSRSEFSMTQEEFDRKMPNEFWREVVDRVKKEKLDTLLLAEAFWLLEGYFVRTLGMHRVYNSAFMNMLRDEENKKFRASIKNTLEYDPRILQRFVNFMSNPDEETAVKQFGKGDKYFGVFTLLATLPGLPMIAHGQIEGYEEKYGMEYTKAYWNEKEDTELIKRQEKEIFPLLKRRELFAYVENFRLYEFIDEKNFLNENVIIYSNNKNNQFSLVIFNNHISSTKGWIKQAAPFKNVFSEKEDVINSTLAENLGLNNKEGYFLIFEDVQRNLKYLYKSKEIFENGLEIELKGYEYRVFMNFAEIKDNKWRHYEQLYNYLGKQGVPDINYAMKHIIIQGIHQAFNELIGPAMLQFLMENSQYGLDKNNKLDEAIIFHVKEKMLHVLEEIEKTLKIETFPEKGLEKLLEALKKFYFFTKLKKDAEISEKDSFKDTIETLLNQPPLSLRIILISIILDSVSNSITNDEEIASEMIVSRIDEWNLNTIIETSVKNDSTILNLENLEVPIIKALILYYKKLRNVIILNQDVQSLKSNLKHFFYDLFMDPLTHDMIGINKYGGVVWFNKERFEILISYLISMISIVSIKINNPLEEILELLKKFVFVKKVSINNAERSKYDLNEFLNSFK